MSIALLVRSLAAAGATPEVIAIAVAAMEEERAKEAAADETRRASQRDRTRRSREKAKGRNVTVTLPTVTVTSLSRDPSPLNDPQPLLPTVEDNLNTPPKEKDPTGPKRKGPIRKLPTALPDDWQPSEPVVSRLREKGIRAADRQAALDEMRCWAHGKDERRADWNATFEGWAIRNAQRSTGNHSVNGHFARSPPAERPRTVHDVARELEARFAGTDGEGDYYDEFDLLPRIRQQAH